MWTTDNIVSRIYVDGHGEFGYFLTLGYDALKYECYLICCWWTMIGVSVNVVMHGNILDWGVENLQKYCTL